MKKGLKIIYKMQNVGRKMKKKKQILFDYVHKQILNITGILLKIVNITKKICVCAYKCIKDRVCLIFRLIKRIISNVIKFTVDNFTIIMYVGFSLLFWILLIMLIFYERMGEVDTALKYILFPIYSFSALFSGRVAKNKIEHRIIVVLKREPESRWAKRKEIIENRNIEKINISDKEYAVAGIPFIVDKEDIYVDNSESHSLIIGSTGSGKTRRLVLPLLNILARAGQSVVATDPKGELYSKTSKLYNDLGYKVISINLRNPEKGNAWNPLDIPYEFYKLGNRDKAIELIYDLGLNIFFDKSNTNADPFWERSASNYFSGLVLALFEDANENEINLNSIINMSAKGKEKIGENTYIQEFFNLKDKTNISYTSASGTVNAPSQTQGGILSVFEQKLTTFSSKAELSKMLAYSDFKMENIGSEKTIVYIIMQDEKSTYHPLVSAFIKQCYEVLIGTAQEYKGRLPIRTNFVLDEFANLPPISDMSNMITAARSRNIRLNLIIQGAEQLSAQYGKETAEVIKGNCTNWFFLISKELQLLKDISELCGNTEVRTGFNEYREKPLISVSQLQRFEIGEILIRRDREHPYKAFLPDISEYTYWTQENGIDEVVNKRDEVHIFDIQEYVKKVKKEKMEAFMREQGFNTQKMSSDVGAIKKQPEMNVDELIKKIDKKIKEIEDEEEKNKNRKNRNKNKRNKNSGK